MLNKNCVSAREKPVKSKKINFQFIPKEDGDGIAIQAESHQTIDLNKLAGCNNDTVFQELIASAALVKIASDDAQKLNILVQTLAECEPKDINEARLCLQASNLYSEGMHYLCQAKMAEMPHAEFYMKSGIKLLRLHNETIEALNRYRRGGEQKVIVQHVNVNEGGQAIVGNIKTGGRGN